jgi:rRNA-processing protein FCF1
MVLEEWAAEIDRDLSALLLEHSSIRDLDDERDPHSGLVFFGAHYAFNDLSLEARRLQSKLLGDLKPFVAMARALLWRAPAEARKELDEAEKAILNVVEQTHCIWHKSPEAALETCRKGVRELFDAIHALHEPEQDSVLLIPDTNALLYNPSIATWSYPGIERATLVLVPTVLSELDELKMSHKNPDVREKAESIIRQVKEFRRRGSLTVGVPIVKGRLSMRALAVEPKVAETLPWLTADSNDDRILASTIEIMRFHPRATMALVTRDINLQNKAEVARIPYLEPPQPESK